MRVQITIQGVTPLLMNRFTEKAEIAVSGGTRPTFAITMPPATWSRKRTGRASRPFSSRRRGKLPTNTRPPPASVLPRGLREPRTVPASLHPWYQQLQGG